MTFKSGPTIRILEATTERTPGGNLLGTKPIASGLGDFAAASLHVSGYSVHPLPFQKLYC